MPRLALLIALVPLVAAPYPRALPQTPASVEPREESAVRADLFQGTWVADISKSKQDPKYALQSGTLHITVNRDSVTMSTRAVTSSGKVQRLTETFQTDGKETPGTLTPGVSHVAVWIGSHVLAMTASKGGEVIGIVTYQVSRDGKTLTSRGSGMAEYVLVFDRK